MASPLLLVSIEADAAQVRGLTLLSLPVRISHVFQSVESGWWFAGSGHISV